MSRVFANGTGDWYSTPCWDIPKTQKMVLDTTLLSTQHYKVRIKGKREQSRKRSSAPETRCSSYQKGSLRVTLDYGRQLYWLTFIYKVFGKSKCDQTLASGADGNYTRILHVWNKSSKQLPTKEHLYDHLTPISRSIQVWQTRHVGHCWGSKDGLLSDILLFMPLYGCASVRCSPRTYIHQLCVDISAV